MKIVNYELHRVHLPLPWPIGDSQVRFYDHWMTVLELSTDNGIKGVGFELQQGIPTPGLTTLQAQFEYGAWPTLVNRHPTSLALRITRPRGGNVDAPIFSLAVETALWDLAAKSCNLPLYRMLGGQNSKVPAYGSTLDFHLDDSQFRNKLEKMVDMGFRAVKIKVGHPNIQWDLRRLGIVHEVMGNDIDLMVDANEAWSTKEALLRAKHFHDEGFLIFWIEDPITRENYQDYARLCSEISFTRINTGEYLGFSGKQSLLVHQAVDVLNVHDSISSSRAAAHLAGQYGIPVSLGNTMLEIGVHLAASLPECLYLEFSNLPWNELAQQPIEFSRGYLIAPDRPGHGIELDRDKLAHYSEPD